MEENNTTVAPAPKAKVNLLPWILCVVLLLVAGGLLAWKLIDNNADNKTNCVEAVENDEKEENKTENDEKEENKTENDEKEENKTENNEQKSSGAYGGYVADGTYGSTYVTKDGDLYYLPTYQYKKISVKNGTSLGKFGTYTLSADDLGGNFDTFSVDRKITIDAYKIAIDNVRSAAELRFGNGTPEGNFIVFTKDGKIYAFKVWANYNGATVTELEAKMIGEINKYDGAVATQEVNTGDGIHNIIIYGDGSYEMMDCYNIYN